MKTEQAKKGIYSNAEENKTRKKIFLLAISVYQLSRDHGLNL